MNDVIIALLGYDYCSDEILIVLFKKLQSVENAASGQLPPDLM